MDHEGDERFMTGGLPLADLWLAKGARAHTPGDGMRQRLLAYFAPVMATIVLLWHVPLVIQDPVLRPPRIVAFAFCALALATPYWLRRFPVRAVALAAVVAGHVGVVLSFLLNDGLSGPSALSIVCLPIISAVLLSPRAGWIDATGIFLLAVALEVFAGGRGLAAIAPFEVRPLLRLMNLAFSLAASMLIIAAFARLTRLQQERLRELAHHDYLTGLFNRHHVWQVIPAELAGLRRRQEDARDRPYPTRPALGVALVDIDHFKSVNDTWGHSAGDRTLRDFALALNATSRDADIVARWGGEEFLVLLRDLSHEDLAKSPCRILEGIRALVLEPVEGERLDVTCSIGFSHVPELIDGAPVAFEHVVRLAEAALSEAKRGGRDHAVGYLWTRPIAGEELEAACGDAAGALGAGALERASSRAGVPDGI